MEESAKGPQQNQAIKKKKPPPKSPAKVGSVGLPKRKAVSNKSANFPSPLPELAVTNDPCNAAAAPSSSSKKSKKKSVSQSEQVKPSVSPIPFEELKVISTNGSSITEIKHNKSPSVMESKQNKTYSQIGKKQSKNQRWWSKLKDIDPITLMPLRNLKEPPFELRVEGSDIYHYFDSKSLAIYLLGTGKFLNPINRQPISREDCLRLDAHLRKYGMRDQAKVVEMMDLQNKVVHVSETDDSRAASLRREAGVIAAHLFQYPSRRDQRRRDQITPPITENTNNFNRNAVERGFVDDDLWETIQEDTVQPPEDFPQLPSTREHTGPQEEFPPMGRISEAPTRPRPNVLPTWAKTVSEQLDPYSSLSQASSAIGRSSAREHDANLSWYRDKHARASALASLEQNRPRLILTNSGIRKPPQTSTRSEYIFGRARPVDTSKVFLSSEPVSTSKDQSKVLCPYPPRILAVAKEFGSTWVSSIEKKFQELIDSRVMKTIQFEPMKENRRKFVQEIGARYWGLSCVELDPEPNRFIQVSLTSTSFPPDLLLSKSLVLFSSLINVEISSYSYSNALVLLGCSLGIKNSMIREALRDLQVKESEYDISFLDSIEVGERIVFLEFTSTERARKTYKRLQPAGPVRCKKILWWPSGSDWVKTQIQFIKANNSKATTSLLDTSVEKVNNRPIFKEEGDIWDDIEDQQRVNQETKSLSSSQGSSNDSTSSSSSESGSESDSD